MFVPGIKCEGCKATIESGLTGIAGVSSIKVDVKEKIVTVNYDAVKDPMKEITAKLKKIYGEVYESL